jgi:HEAT repeat protein
VTVEELIRQLGDRDWRVRQRACQELAKSGDARAIEPLIGRLGDLYLLVRQAAARALEGFGEGRLVRAALGAVEETQGSAAAQDLLALCAEGDTRWLAPVLARLADTDRNVRQRAYDMLERAGETRVAQAVRNVLRQAPEAVTELAALAAEGDLRPVEPLVALLDDVPAIRDAAARSLAGMAEVWEGRAGELLCRACLARLEYRRRVVRWREDARWLACRSCQRAAKVLKGVQQVVAVLNERRAAEQAWRDGVLEVNWLKRRTLFDFDRVAIVRATDEEVERFAIQVSNDTDEWRQPCYKRMVCAVARQCALSENTLRILRQTFGEVVRA